MCLILVAHRPEEPIPLLVLANRDEFYDRSSEAADYWQESPEMIAGRDLVSGGAWFGVKNQRWAPVTNLSAGVRQKHPRPNRIGLGDGNELWYATNRNAISKRLKPGIYGLSNCLLDTPWPKVVRGKEALERLLKRPSFDYDAAFALLTDTTRAPDTELPDTAIPLEWERALSAIFITMPSYGTRCSTLFMTGADGHKSFLERRYNRDTQKWQQSEFSWKAKGSLLDR
jgi:uncharacterized protein with NRDE domain